MNLWTFLDRNSGGLFFLVLIAFCFGFGWCGDGCKVQCPAGVTIITGPSDGGAP